MTTVSLDKPRAVGQPLFICLLDFINSTSSNSGKEGRGETKGVQLCRIITTFSFR